jgi:hypothetical protein
MSCELRDQQCYAQLVMRNNFKSFLLSQSLSQMPNDQTRHQEPPPPPPRARASFLRLALSLRAAFRPGVAVNGVGAPPAAAALGPGRARWIISGRRSANFPMHTIACPPLHAIARLPPRNAESRRPAGSMTEPTHSAQNCRSHLQHATAPNSKRHSAHLCAGAYRNDATSWKASKGSCRAGHCSPSRG